MNRITPEQVVEAYRKTGLRPVRASFGNASVGEGNECCGLVACAIDRIGGHEFLDRRVGAPPCPTSLIAKDALDINDSYLVGFMDGFDGYDEGGRALSGSRDYDHGYEDGAGAWAALVDAGLAR